MKNIIQIILSLSCLFYSAISSGQIEFIENKGQVIDQFGKLRNDIFFYGQDQGLKFNLNDKGYSYELMRPENSDKESLEQKINIARVDMLLVNSSIDSDNILPNDENLCYLNFYNLPDENHVLHVSTFSTLEVREVYDGIDMVFHGKENLKYDFVVHPGSNYQQIKIEVAGGKVHLNEKGQVIISTSLGDIVEEAPLCFQNGRLLDSRWIVNENILQFEVDNINPNETLIIDPSVRAWGTYFGGEQLDRAEKVSANALGEVTTVGITNSTMNIATVGAHQTTINANEDCFISHYNANGIKLWSTYYGGEAQDWAHSCDIDPLNNDILVVGRTMSKTNITTIGSHQEICAGPLEGFLARFDNSGALLWATYYGGSGSDHIRDCSVDELGFIYACGTSDSDEINAISTPGSHQETRLGAGTNAFLVKFDSNGNRLWGTFYGGSQPVSGIGSGGTESTGCASEPGAVYLVGRTSVVNEISTLGAHQPTHAGNNNFDGFLVRFTDAGVREWGTYYGGTESEEVSSCAVGTDGAIYITGVTRSSNFLSIATPGTHQSSKSGFDDGFLAKFSRLGIREWGTYFGGPDSDQIFDCSTDLNGNIFICGMTNSSTQISTTGSFQPAWSGSWDAFLANFDENGYNLVSTYYGGIDDDRGLSCFADEIGSVYMCGLTQSTAGGIISTPGSDLELYQGGTDAYLVKFSNDFLKISNHGIDFSTPFIIYPNPTEGLIWLSEVEDLESEEYFLYDLNGEFLFSGQNIKGQPLDLSNLSSGIYILRIGKMNFRIVKS